MDAALEARSLTVAREGVEVVHDVSFTLGAGEAVALVGPNAAGKSTLLQALAGLLPAQAGVVLVHGRPLSAWRRHALARSVAFVASNGTGPAFLSVGDRVRLGRYPHRGPFLPMGAADEAAVAQALHLTGLADLAHRRLSTLSAGERQMAALARGLAQEPSVLLLDEPAAHLDIGHELGLFRILEQACRQGMAVLAVIHDLQRAAAWAGRMLLLDAGRLVAEGRPDDVLSSPACARAFGVRIQSHIVTGQPRPLYSYGEDNGPDAA